MRKLWFVLLLLISTNIFAKELKEFKVAWSHYVGWEPWAYMEKEGILDKWATKYNIKIKLSAPMDYMESINLYTAGNYDACVMTNMESLTVPAVGGKDSTALIIGDFSNGNDGILAYNAKDISGIIGKQIKLVQYSVSDYLLYRYLTMNKHSVKDVRTINTSDSDIGSIFITDRNSVVVTWNPILMQLRNEPNATLLFDSSQIPGEIIDMLVVRTDAPDTLKRALTGAWYETMGIMSRRSKKSFKAIEFMAKNAEATVPQFKAMLKTTDMFYRPSKAVAFIESPKLKKTMEYVRNFYFSNGLLPGSKDVVGIQFPDGTILGDKNNVKLRFDSSYTRLAVDKNL